MAEYVTKTELLDYAQENLTEARRRVAKASRQLNNANVFLSHSSKDKAFIPGALALLESHGGSVYIDEIDPDMPPYTNEETANKLKGNIKKIDKFVLLATKNSKSSKWVPWELGVADGYKGLKKIAVLPAIGSETDESWTEWEYMGLYRKISYGELEGYDESLWIVWNTKENTATALNKWLSNSH